MSALALFAEQSFLFIRIEMVQVTVAVVKVLRRNMNRPQPGFFPARDLSFRGGI